MSQGFFGFPNILGLLRMTAFKALGKPGATSGATLAGGTASGAPTSGAFDALDFIVTADGTLWICTTAGTPGTWTQVVGGSGSYTLPAATTSVLGGVKPRTGLVVQSDGTVDAGTGTPPARLWRQGISTAAPTTVTTATAIADGFYNTGPSLVVTRTGTLLLAYREATGDATVGGKVVTQRSTDGGATWAAKVYAATPAGGHDYREPNTCCTPSGRIVLAYTETVNETNDYASYVRHSDDNGATWSSAVAVTGFSGWTYTSGTLLQHSSGTLLLPIYGTNSGDSDTRCGTLRSVDDGVTWSAVCTMGGANTSYSEVGLVELPDRSITAYIRDEVGSTGLRTSTSTDAGATWSAPAAISFSARHGRATPILVPVSQELILFYRSTTGPSNVVYRWSSDLGATWSGEISLVAHPFVYAGAAALEDHLVGIAYAYETTAGAVAEVHFLSMAAGVPTVSGSRSSNAAVASLLSGLAQRGAVIDGTSAGTAPLTGLAVSHNGTAVATEAGLNVIDGTGVTLTVADNSGSSRVDVTVASTASTVSSLLVLVPNPYNFVDSSASDNGQPPDFITTAAGDVIGVGGV